MSTTPEKNIHFIHLSDPQLIPAGEMNYDINPQLRIRQCIDAILSDCVSLSLDFAVITGDLTHWGEEVAYKVLREELSRLPFPVYMLMGNHDQRETFSTVFPEHPIDDESGFVQYILDSSAGRMIFLDTLDVGKRSGVLCQERLQWLESMLTDSEGQPVYLFMHHPPFTVGLSAMDDDNLVNADEFLQAVKPYLTQIRHIFFGHLHRTVTGSWHGISYSCPLSPVHQTAFEFGNKPESKKPSYVSPEPPAYHLVELKPEQVVVHSRLFLHSEPAIDSRSCYRYQLHGQLNKE